MSLAIQQQGIDVRPPEAYQVPAPEPKNTAIARDSAMDFTKGMLVLFMVLYHWLNYFVGPQGHYYNYLRFLTPSFIFISGFMISRIHLNRYEKSGRRLSKRLTVRGAKLLALVFLLNVVASFITTRFEFRPATVATFLRNMTWAFIIANPTSSEGQKGVVFSMLVPIAYLLIVSALLIIFTARERSVFRYALVLLIGVVALSYAYGMVNAYLDLLLIGIFGVVIGFADQKHIAFVLNHPYALIAMYCCYLVVITFWAVTLPLQIASVILTTALLYIAGSRKSGGIIWQRTVLLGKYSLLGYVAQIAILQALRRVPWLSRHSIGILLASLMLGTVLTLIVVEITDIVRRKSTVADGLYRFVFA